VEKRLHIRCVVEEINIPHFKHTDEGIAGGLSRTMITNGTHQELVKVAFA